MPLYVPCWAFDGFLQPGIGLKRNTLCLILFLSCVMARNFRFVGRSLLLLLGKSEAIQQAIAQGAHVELCMLSPHVSPYKTGKLSDLEVLEIQAAVSIFKKKLV